MNIPELLIRIAYGLLIISPLIAAGVVAWGGGRGEREGSVFGEFALITGMGVVVAAIPLFIGDVWQDNIKADAEKKEKISEHIDRLLDRYDLHDLSFTATDEGVLTRVFFSEADGDRCEGDVDGDVLVGVTCQQIYRQEE